MPCDPPDIRETLRTQGFAVVRNVVPLHEIAELRAAFTRLLEHAHKTEHAEHFVVDTDPFRLHRVVWCGSIDPVFERYGSDRRFLELAALALGSSSLLQLIQQAHFKLPGDSVDFAWHQDASNRRYGTDLWTDVDGHGSFIQIALAIDPMTSENGPLRAIPGSHNLGFIANPRTGALPADAVQPEHAVDLLLDPGDVALFGPFLLHGSAPNTSVLPRRLFLQGYTLPGANRRIYPGCGTGVPRTLRD